MKRTLAAVLELAGGLLPTAALRHIEVQRLVAHDKQTMLEFGHTGNWRIGGSDEEAGVFRNPGRGSDQDFSDRVV